jgi:hypothetical protein
MSPGFIVWRKNMSAFEGFAVHLIPEGGFYSTTEQNWLLRPSADWKLHEEGSWLEVGGPGVDGISFALRKECGGVFAYYPLGREFVWKAKDGASLISGWVDGSITV